MISYEPPTIRVVYRLGHSATSIRSFCIPQMSSAYAQPLGRYSFCRWATCHQNRSDRSFRRWWRQGQQPPWPCPEAGQAPAPFRLRSRSCGHASLCSIPAAAPESALASWHKSIPPAPSWHWDPWSRKLGIVSAGLARSPCSSDGTAPSVCRLPGGVRVRERCILRLETLSLGRLISGPLAAYAWCRDSSQHLQITRKQQVDK